MRNRENKFHFNPWEDFIMDGPAIELARKMTEKLEKFLRACKEEGDVTVDDVLKRLEDLKKET